MRFLLPTGIAEGEQSARPRSYRVKEKNHSIRWGYFDHRGEEMVSAPKRDGEKLATPALGRSYFSALSRSEADLVFQ